MNITIGEIIIWLIVGGFAGSVVGAVAKGKKEGYGKLKNFTIGLIGAVIGGALFNLLNIDLGLGEWKITFEDLIAALLGSFLLLLILWLVGKKKAGKKKAA